MDLSYEKNTGGVDMWGNMMATQHLLERKYQKEFGVKIHDCVEERIMALRDEVMEYAKSTKCFKYWSHSDADPEEVRLEEFADGIHFYLQHAIRLNMDPQGVMDVVERAKVAADIYLAADKIGKPNKKSLLTLLLSQAMDHLKTPSQSGSTKQQRESLEISFVFFLAAGQVDGFTDPMIEKAYYLKNRKNQERLANGY